VSQGDLDAVKGRVQIGQATSGTSKMPNWTLTISMLLTSTPNLS
jgi:hypothetical protein